MAITLEKAKTQGKVNKPLKPTIGTTVHKDGRRD